MVTQVADALGDGGCSSIRTGPATPTAPRWMWAAAAGPISFAESR